MKTTLNTAKNIAQLEAENAKLKEQLASVESQLIWLKRQLFGKNSERYTSDESGYHQLDMFADDLKKELLDPPKEDRVTVPAHTRKKRLLPTTPDDSGLRFSSDVPMKTIEVACPELESHPDDYEVVDEKVTYRLAQKPSSYHVLRYVRKVIKKKTTQSLITTPAPFNVFEKSCADVSFLVGMLIDKFQYHLPLYRQHLRLEHAGVLLSRNTLSNLVLRSIELLKPIYDAQLRSVLGSQVLAMDETTIKAGRQGQGKMKTGYFWPLYGDQDELVFHYAPTRAASVVDSLLIDFKGVLLSDGYKAYEQYAAHSEGVVHAQCWAHSRRKFEQALKMEPDAADWALKVIALLYKVEDKARKKKLIGEKKRIYRAKYAKEIVDVFFAWVKEQRQRPDLIASNDLTKALLYVERRERSLRVFLENPDVPIDTNHLERGLRPIPMGRKNWLFCWTEIGAKQVGVIQSLIETCKLHGVNTHDYLTDVLLRVNTHPASKVKELIPRLWKERFADQPMRSDLYEGQ